MTQPEAAEALEACLAQLHRTAAWLRSLPLARFSRDDGAVESRAREVIARVAECVQAACQSMQDRAQRSASASGTGTHARAVQDADCPPADAMPDRLAAYALGDQLAAHAGDLARCGSAAMSMGMAVSRSELDAIAAAALGLRSAG